MSMILDKNVCLQGCDISKYQGAVDFFKMKSAGVKFVMLRAGYGTSTVDSKFRDYVDGATKAGLMIGVYWFIYANNISESVKNAMKCLEVIEPHKDKIKLGVYADWEYDSEKKLPALSSILRSELVKVFLDTITNNSKFSVGIYSNQDYIKSGKFTPELIASYPLWYAFYTSTNYSAYGNKGKDGHPYIWQYTSSGNGKQYGVASTNIDLDRGYFRIEEDTVKPVSSIIKVKPIANIIKGNAFQFKQIISNIKLALNTDFNLKMDIYDGTVTTELMNHLKNVNVNTSNGIFVPNTVYALQQLLVWWGYSLTVDGKFGPVTEKVIETFQRQVGIPITKSTSYDFWRRILNK